MMKVFMFLLFVIPLIFYGYWWLFLFLFMIYFFFFIHSFWFMNYFCMVSYFFGGDLLSMSMLILVFWIIFLMILSGSFVYNYKMYSLEFLFSVLFLSLFLFLSFSTMNIFMFYVFFESSIIPVLFMIFGWGYQPERLMAGFYLFFYTLFASMPLFLGIVYTGNFSTFFYFLIMFNFNFYFYFCFILAFLVKMPMIFVHFWLLSAHVEAPVFGSMILAGVLLKLGGYGLLRVFSFIVNFNYNYLVVSLSMYGCFLSTLLCLYQFDVKMMIAYSSVVHMGMVISGIFTVTSLGLLGSLILMIGHGLCSSGLFCLANIFYVSVHSRSFYMNSGLISLMPSLCLFWFLLCCNNMASPFSVNFFGEILLIICLMGWSGYSFLFLFFLSFLSCVYSIYLYSFIFHGSLFSGLFNVKNNSFCDYYLGLMHLFPLNFLFLKIDFFMIYL